MKNRVLFTAICAALRIWGRDSAPHATAHPVETGPCEHYRLLNEGEELKEGDEYVDSATRDSVAFTWIPICPQVYGLHLLKYNVGFFRRKLSTSHPVETCPCGVCVDARQAFSGSPKVWGPAGSLRGYDENQLRRDIVFANRRAEAWEKSCKDAYAALKLADKEVASLSIEVLDRNQICERLGVLLQRAKCGCVYLDCAKHGSYLAEDCEL